VVLINQWKAVVLDGLISLATIAKGSPGINVSTYLLLLRIASAYLQKVEGKELGGTVLGANYTQEISLY
jgi:hypothetical protein